MRLYRPMHEMLSSNLDRLHLHVPGHKGKDLFDNVPAQTFDTTELGITDDLYAPTGAIQLAQEQMALSAGAGHTLFLTGGSTAGILTMLLYSAKPGDTVILPRNAHQSCINGCVLADLHPAYVPFEMTEDGYAYAPEEAFLKVIAHHPKAAAVLVTRPDYYGGMVPLAKIAKAAHDLGMRLLIDEAHGAHLNWMTDIETASSAGADLWVQSAHKTLPALTAGAFLHLGKNEDVLRARRMLRMVQTSSPAFYLMKSLDDARAWMDTHGKPALEKLQGCLHAFRSLITELGYQDAHALWSNQPLTFDPTRLVLSAPQGGYALADALMRLGVDVEMADERRIVCIMAVMDGRQTLDRLEAALKAATYLPAVNTFLPAIPLSLPVQKLSLRQAALGDTQWVALEKSAGRILASSIGLYPPGVPLAAPGEEMTGEIAAILLSAPEKNRFGIHNGNLLCVKE